MSFVFPDNKIFIDGFVRNRTNAPPYHEPIDIENPIDNIIEINGTDYVFTYLHGPNLRNKGGHSIILKLYNSQNIDTNDIDYGDPDLILKISKHKNQNFPSKNQKRFTKEVEALTICNSRGLQNVIRAHGSGICRIKDFKGKKHEEYLYYLMEYAQCDLKSYIEENHNVLNIDEKLSLCISICEGLKELYSLGYFHRDIKPDNIFMVDNIWKIGDLGLVAERNNKDNLDDDAERIGPIGWLSPEAMNKYLCETKGFSYNHSCEIDHQSDIFQLGKVFWYVFQHNAPIGSVKESDFILRSSSIYSILKTMLNHSKNRRYKSIEEVIKLLKIVQRNLLVKAA